MITLHDDESCGYYTRPVFMPTSTVAGLPCGQTSPGDKANAVQPCKARHKAWVGMGWSMHVGGTCVLVWERRGRGVVLP